MYCLGVAYRKAGFRLNLATNPDVADKRMNATFTRLRIMLVLLALAMTTPLPVAIATDGQPILELGIVGWIDFQRRSLLSEVREVNIEDGKISPLETVVSIYEAVMFHNIGQENHRLVFLPDTGNKMEQAYTSGVIRPDKRWGAEFHGFGLFPYRCTIHPEEHGEISVIL